jgi:hypothetical protein
MFDVLFFIQDWIQKEIILKLNNNINIITKLCLNKLGEMNYLKKNLIHF